MQLVESSQLSSELVFFLPRTFFSACTGASFAYLLHCLTFECQAALMSLILCCVELKETARKNILLATTYCIAIINE